MSAGLPPTAGGAPRPWLSVITVCFNAEALLPGTLASLRAQQVDGVEWVVVDGASRDGSLAWLQAQQPHVLLSEPDKGIYDAMNKAVQLAHGEWLYFLNAGDTFADAQVLADVKQALQAQPHAELAWGDVLYFGERGERLRRFHWLTRQRLLFGDLCHQAAFARRSLFERHGLYDTNLRWNADFDWFLRVFSAGARLHYFPRVVARFHDAGAHVQAAQRCAAERDTVRARRLPLWAWRWGHLALRVEHRVRRWLGQAI